MLLDLFGCSHRQISRVFTDPKPKPSKSPTRSYVVCLACGVSFQYDLAEMRQGSEIRETAAPTRWDCQLETE